MKKKIVTLNISEQLLEKIDVQVKKNNTNRSAYIETILTNPEKNTIPDEHIKKTFDAFVKCYMLVYDTVKTVKPDSKEIINEMQKLSNLAQILLGYMKELEYDYHNQ